MWRLSGSHFATLAGILIYIPGELCYILYLLCAFKLKKEMKHLEDCRSSYEDALKKFNKAKHVDKRSKVSCVYETYISEWQFERTFIFFFFYDSWSHKYKLADRPLKLSSRERAHLWHKPVGIRQAILTFLIKPLFRRMRLWGMCKFSFVRSCSNTLNASNTGPALSEHSTSLLTRQSYQIPRPYSSRLNIHSSFNMTL